MRARYERLQVWQKAHSLTLDIYRITAQFPATEQYGLTSQLRRAAASIGANIAEGNSRLSLNEFRQFLSISRGSTNEVDYFIILSCDLGYITTGDSVALRERCEEIKRMITGLINSVSRRSVSRRLRATKLTLVN